MTVTIGRRELLAALGGAATIGLPLAARGQQPGRMRRIGYLRAAPPPERDLQAFLRALAEHDYVQGRNFVLITEWGDGRIARLPELSVALVNAGVDIIVTEGTLAVRAVHAVTATIPIVMTGVADPFVFGLVKDLSRPGGNITGFSSLERDIAGKMLEILKEIVPGWAGWQSWPRAKFGNFSPRPRMRLPRPSPSISPMSIWLARRPVAPQCDTRCPWVRRLPCSVAPRSFRPRSARCLSTTLPSIGLP
jgi:hypothetical protein